MSPVAAEKLVKELLQLPDQIEKSAFPFNQNDDRRREFSIPVDILETPKQFIFYIDLPGLSKTDIQVTVEDENVLVIKNNGKRKRDEEAEAEEEGTSSCKYIRLERRAFQKFVRKFRLPENSNVGSISAKCENGVLAVVVEKLPPPPKPKTVQVAIS